MSGKGKKGHSLPQIAIPDSIDPRTRQSLESTFKQGYQTLVSKAKEHSGSNKKNKKEKEEEARIGQQWQSFSEQYKSASSFFANYLTSETLNKEDLEVYKNKIMSFYQFLSNSHKNQVYGEFCQNMIDKLITYFGKIKAEHAPEKSAAKHEEALTSRQVQKPVFSQNKGNNRNKYAHLSKKNKPVFSSIPVQQEAQKVSIPKFNIDIDGEEVAKESVDPIIKEEVSNMLETIGSNVIDKLSQLEEKHEDELLEDELPNTLNEVSHKILPQTDLKEEDNLLEPEEEIKNDTGLLGTEQNTSLNIPSLDVKKPKGKKKKVIVFQVLTCGDCTEDEDVKMFMGLQQ